MYTRVRCSVVYCIRVMLYHEMYLLENIFIVETFTVRVTQKQTQ
jgi:hypothetical protein